MNPLAVGGVWVGRCLAMWWTPSSSAWNTGSDYFFTRFPLIHSPINSSAYLFCLRLKTRLILKIKQHFCQYDFLYNFVNLALFALYYVTNYIYKYNVTKKYGRPTGSSVLEFEDSRHTRSLVYSIRKNRYHSAQCLKEKYRKVKRGLYELQYCT
jgi:hypothetical protein